MNIETRTIDKLFLELSQVTKATTAKEILLEKQVASLQSERRTTEAIREAVKWLENAERDATMERSVFDRMFPDDSDPLPTSELEVTEFVRRRTQLWRETWVLAPIREALALLRK